MPKLLFVITLFSFGASLFAQPLIFEKGATGTFLVRQQLKAAIAGLDHDEDDPLDRNWFSEVESESSIEVEMTLLSLDKKKGKPSFEVELRLKKIAFNEEQQDGYTYKHIFYDSTVEPEKKNNRLAKDIETYLLNKPIVFRVEKEGKVTELTDVFETFGGTSSDFGFVGTTSWSLESFLYDFFQLAGENLEVNRQYAVNPASFLNWEDESLEEIEKKAPGFTLENDCYFLVTEINDEKIEASRHGKIEFQAIDEYEEALNISASLSGKGQWDLKNAFHQNRTIDLHLKEKTESSWFSTEIDLTVHQTWEFIP